MVISFFLSLQKQQQQQADSTRRERMDEERRDAGENIEYCRIQCREMQPDNGYCKIVL